VDKLAQEVPPILIMCVVIALVVRRLPKVDVGHSEAFRRRRILNWLPLGLTYAFLYMGRYNIVSLKSSDIALITNKEFGDIDAIGSLVYGLAFLINGPLTDKFGGRLMILIAAVGAAVCNLAMGIVIATSPGYPSVHMLMLLFALNMYFQSFGAVAIVKVNASWFHLRERGTFGGIFGILISLGLYLAFDWAPKIASLTAPAWLFFSPALILMVFFVLSFIWVRDTPDDAGFPNFDVADASSGETGKPDPALVMIKRMITHKVILVIAFISLCSGFLRQGILKWYLTFADGVGVHSFVNAHWGMMSCIAGMLGGMFAGVISDHLFHSRRPPVSVVLYGVLLVGTLAITASLTTPAIIPWVIMGMAMAVIGVHGMLSGVASQDFGGRRNAGTATGLIDGFVYFGTALQGVVYGNTLVESKLFIPDKIPVFELAITRVTHNPEASDISNWYAWPIAMIPIAVIGLILSLTVIRAVVAPKSAAH
jgi:OPA family glycerol-3-phosphate transporter-like MFS transporter